MPGPVAAAGRRAVAGPGPGQWPSSGDSELAGSRCFQASAAGALRDMNLNPGPGQAAAAPLVAWAREAVSTDTVDSEERPARRGGAAPGTITAKLEYFPRVQWVGTTMTNGVWSNHNYCNLMQR